jgi:hypothetical protein
MDQLICSKCNTPNIEGADKCINCGFVFSNQKMKTVGKYLGDVAEYTSRNTILENDQLYSKPTIDEHPKIDEKLTHFEADPTLITFESKDENKSTARIQTELSTILTESEEMSETELLCSKCGYILSAASLICPSCGHNNKPVSKTVAMPIKEVHEQQPLVSQSIQPTEITSAHRLSSDHRDPAKTIAESSLEFGTQGTNTFDTNDTLVPNKTIREDNTSTYRTAYEKVIKKENLNKSPIRLEAVFLGQDSDQNMVVNIPLDSNKISINRASIDESDSTISAVEHASIYKEGDQWKIQNKASNKAVFVQVNNEANIQHGDIIMLGGDKFYVFIDEVDLK